MRPSLSVSVSRDGDEEQDESKKEKSHSELERKERETKIRGVRNFKSFFNRINDRVVLSYFVDRFLAIV